ncbi:ABC transporter substrate-binding protein [Pelagibius sp. Alg239-R121]|uniref:ABC transporter substrate-binding protein n=1 Tax=Pelagibius sp. Alg239-R121 TaxID=2993448 RepID=UPI0024A6BA3B|nr:extracellular solute-binding protein [Pelagibius sp. Alg239-R121]
MKRILMGAIASVMISTAAPAVEIESRTLDQLYTAAKEEGGNLVLWAGGDKPDQSDFILDMFKEDFPDINVIHRVDLSKYHAPRFDNALENGGEVPDVIQLQTLYDFDYWTRRGELLAYKPKDWDKVYPAYRDPNGHWTGLFGVSFSNLINTDLIGEDKAPRDAMDYLDPALKGKVILTYPHDDDAVLYQFWHLKQKYGWDYLEKLVANEPVWVRGTSMPYVAIGSGWYPASFTTSWSLVPFQDSPVKFLLPKKDFFLTWIQTAAIPAKAKNKATAKLYTSWMLSKRFQSKWLQWPVRTDVEAPGGFKAVQHHNTSPEDFHRFMLDRATQERFRFQMEQLVGPIEGVSPLDMDYGLKP